MNARKIQPVHSRGAGITIKVLRMGRDREDPKSPFGWYLRGLMDAAGFETDTALYLVSGVPASVLSKWQSGTVRPTVDSLRKIAPHLRVRLCDLMVEAELATPAELGMVTEVMPVPPPLDRSVAALTRFLADEAIPEPLKDNVRGNLDTLIAMAAKMKPLPHEPSAEERAAGKGVKAR